MRLGVVACVFSVGLAGFGAAAWAAPGVVVSPANLRAGPGPDYPLVAGLAPGTQAEIFGCESGWGWCDVGLDGGLRGLGVGPAPRGDL